MDLEDLRAFIKVAELASFSRAGEQLGASKSRVSLRVSALEADLGSRLLQRSTRAVRLTPDGEQFLARARRLLTDADELATMFQAPSGLRGRLRVDLPVNFARELVIPRLPEFLAAHPQLDLVLSTTDRRVDLVREGFDCVLRVGALPDSELVVRRMGMLAMANLASPAYVAKFGVPETLEQLAQHQLVHYAQNLQSDAPSFEYWDGERYVQHPMRSVITVNSVDAYSAACAAGLGIIQAPRYGALKSLAAGTLVEVLPALRCEPLRVSLVHGHTRNLPRRVRVFMNWLASLMAPYLERARAV